MSISSLPLGDYGDAVLAYLRGISPPLRSVAGEIIREGAGTGGRRDVSRASLVLWACAACRGDERDALPVGAAFELLDRFMLLHDDLMDGSAAAAGTWGLGQTLNAGDALYALALRALALDAIDAPRRRRAAALVVRAALGAIEGRNSDVARGGEHAGDMLARLRSLRRRGAALTGAALQAGAVIGGAESTVACGFLRAGRLLAAAGACDDSALSRRVADKAVVAMERCIPDASKLDGFARAARGAAQRVA